MGNEKLLDLINLTNESNFSIDYSRVCYNIDYTWSMSIIQVSIINLAIALIMMYFYDKMDEGKNKRRLNQMINLLFLINGINLLLNIFISIGINPI
jgi:hypothetical protein